MTQVPIQTSARSGFPELGAPGLLDTMRSEWTKMKTLRSTYIIFSLGALFILGLSALITFVIAANETSELQHGGTLPSPILTIQGAQVGWEFALLAFMVLGVLVISGEYSSSLIGVTLLATPQRRRFLLAKVLVFAISLFVFTEVMSFVNFFIGHAIVSAYPNYPNTWLSNDGVLRVVIGMGIYVTLIGLMGLGAGALLRNAAGAIAACVGFLFILPIALSALPNSYSNPIGEYWPTQAGMRIGLIHQGAHDLTAWWGAGDMALFIVLLLALTGYALTKRDA